MATKIIKTKKPMAKPAPKKPAPKPRAPNRASGAGRKGAMGATSGY
jgi:hypothetical protein